MERDEQDQTVEVAPFDIHAAVSTIDEEARTVELIFSTGQPFLRFDWLSGKKYMLQLSLKQKSARFDRLNNGAPLLDSHGTFRLSNQIGTVVEGSAKIVKKQAFATVKLSRREEVEPIWQDI